MSDEDLLNNCSHPSIISLNDVTSQSISGPGFGADFEKVIKDFQTQVRLLKCENIGLKRALPRLQDALEKDVTEEMAVLCNKLAEAEENIEEYENLCAKNEQELVQLKNEFFRQIKIMEKEIRDIGERAKDLEDENLKLRTEVENDQSKLFRLQNDSLCADDVTKEQSPEFDLVFKLKQNLDDKISENNSLEMRLKNIQQKINQKNEQMAEMQSMINKQAKSIEIILCGRKSQDIIANMDSPDELSSDSGSANSYTEGDYIAANMLALLNLVSKNNCKMKDIQISILAFLREHGLLANSDHVNKLSEILCEVQNKRRELIKKKNLSLQMKLIDGGNNADLKRHFDALDDDSLASSCANSVIAANDQQPTNFSVSFADIMKNTTCVDFLNKTTEVTHDLGLFMSRMTSLRSVCHELFEKLCGTAEFLERILETLGETEEGRQLLEKIHDLKLDLDKSIHEALYMVDDLHKTEKSLAEFRDLMEQTFENDLQKPLSNPAIDNSLFNEENFFSQQTGGNVSHPNNELCSQQTGGNITHQSNELFSQQSVENLSRTHGISCPTSYDDETVEELKKQLQQLIGVKDLYEALQLTLKKELELKDSLNRKVVSLDTMLKARDSDVLILQNKAQAFEKTVDDLYKALDLKSDEFKNRETEFKRLKEDYDHLCQVLEKHKIELEKAHEQLTVCDQQYASVAQKCESLAFQADEKDAHVEELSEKICELRCVNLETDKTNKKLCDKNFKLEEKYKTLYENYKSHDAFIEKTNEVLYQKIAKGYDKVVTDESMRDDDSKSDGENINNYDEFTKFLEECQKHANCIVQLLKKANETVKTTKEGQKNEELVKQIPLYDHLLGESRIVRLMLHKVTKFFLSRKENINLSKALEHDIQTELQNIYQTLKSAKETTSSIKTSKSTNVSKK